MGAFWDSWNRQGEVNQRESLGALQQASAVQGILAQQQALGERQRLEMEDRNLRGMLAQSGGDPTIAMQSAIKNGNIKGALSLASLMEHQSKAELNKRRGIIDQTLEDPAVWKDPDRLAPLAGRAIGANHPGGASILQYAAKLREEKALQDYLAGRQGGIPGGMPQVNPTPQAMPQSAPMPSAPAMDANGQPVPATAGVPVQMANNEAEARRMLQGATGPMRVQLREQPQSASVINVASGEPSAPSTRQELENMTLNPNKAVRELGKKLLAEKIAAERMAAKPPQQGVWIMGTDKDGAYRTNNRTGETVRLTIDGQPVLPAAVDPTVKSEMAKAGAAGKVEGTRTANAALDLPKVTDQTAYALKLIEDLKADPAKKYSIGLPANLHLDAIKGTPQAGFMARLEQVKGQQFLAAFESLRGGGQITNVEGEKATAAISRMKSAQNVAEFDKAADEYAIILRQGLTRAANMAKMRGTNNALPAPVGESASASPVTPSGLSPQEQAELDSLRQRFRR